MKAVDLAEFSRFFLTGIIATLGNLAAAAAARLVSKFEVALVIGMCAGFCISFVVGKLFAFRSRTLSRTPGEAVRFTLVYLAGMMLSLTVSVAVKDAVPAELASQRVREAAALLTGAALMMATSYFGHRFFTYSTGRRNGRG